MSHKKNWRLLCIENKHERDSHISFDEGTHTYTVNGSYVGYISVTKLIHKFFPEFNPDEVIRKMKNSPKWPDSKYFGMSDDEIKNGWNSNGRSASGAGTKMHLSIEQFINGAESCISDEFKTSPSGNISRAFGKNMVLI